VSLIVAYDTMDDSIPMHLRLQSFFVPALIPRHGVTTVVVATGEVVAGLIVEEVEGAWETVESGAFWHLHTEHPSLFIEYTSTASSLHLQDLAIQMVVVVVVVGRCISHIHCLVQPISLISSYDISVD